MKIVIVDYGMGNLASVKNAFLLLKQKVIVTSSPKDLEKADKVVLPGVGSFAQAICQLEERNLIIPLKEKIKKGVPFLGICLGMQLLFEKSSEAKAIGGLGVLEGEVVKFDQKNLITPHMGWNQVKKNIKLKGQNQDERLFSGIEDNSYFYFAHSYFCFPHKRDIIIAQTNYGRDFASAISEKNIWAVQFHPEKSCKTGLKLLNNFIKT